MMQPTRCPDVIPTHETISLEVYRGPSMFDGNPIVVILTGIGRPSHNAKTGEMIQSYIIRSDMTPFSALTRGLDRTICGMCSWASGNGCYVNVAKSVTNVYDSWHAGSVPAVSPETAAQFIHRSGRSLRIGSYGDPAAVPAHVWRKLLVGATAGHSGYSHAWRDFPQFRDIVMASADSADDAIEAHETGWRTFRVADSAPQERLPGEIVCPASEEAGKKTQCADCLLCAGAGKTAKSIVISDHGRFKSSGRALSVLR